MGATVIGRDLGPRVSSSLTSGLTADCTQLEIGEYDDKKAGKHYDNILYQIRPVLWRKYCGYNRKSRPPSTNGYCSLWCNAESYL